MTPKSLLAPARLAGRPVLRSQSDERLVDLVRAGSEPAFEAIVGRYGTPLLRYCRRILPDTRAEDAVQQAFVSAFDAMRRDDTHIDLRPWLYRIAHNSALNALRDRGLKHAELDEELDGVERPDQAMERRQGLRDVLGAVQALPERQRNAMVLRELEGRSYEEIAGTLGVTGGAVRQLLNRARTTLRAGVTAVTPFPMLVRLWSGEGEPGAARVGELVGAGGAGALATKVAATAIVTGAVAGGIATVPDRLDHRAKATEEPAAATAAPDAGASSDGSSGATQRASSSVGGAADGHSGQGKTGKAGADNSGSGSKDHSGDSGGGDGHSGSGDDGVSGDDGGHSGSEHSGSGSEGSGDGSGQEVSDDGHSGEGSSGSGSGSSGPGPGDDGSGSSGSGSGSSGSGSGSSSSADDPTLTTELDSDHSGSGHSGSLDDH